MYRNAYILIFCIGILVSISYSEYKNMKVASGQAQETELVSGSQTVNMASVSEIDESILIDVVKAEEVATSTPTPTPESVSRTHRVTAESYLVGNLETGEIYLESNTSKVFPIASVSKLYTALVVHHLFDSDNKITITDQMLNAYGNAGNLKVDEKYTSEELLHPLLLESSNDAAEAFAHSFGYEDFIAEMNAFSEEIGMKNTLFADPSGLSSKNVSNASDLFVLSRYLYDSEQDILNISKKSSHSLSENADHISHNYKNINPFSQNPNFLGGKTGRTDEARESMVSLFNKKIGENIYPIAIIVLRSDFGERETNTEKLMNMFVEKMSNNN